MSGKGGEKAQEETETRIIGWTGFAIANSILPGGIASERSRNIQARRRQALLSEMACLKRLQELPLKDIGTSDKRLLRYSTEKTLLKDRTIMAMADSRCSRYIGIEVLV